MLIRKLYKTYELSIYKYYKTYGFLIRKCYTQKTKNYQKDLTSTINNHTWLSHNRILRLTHLVIFSVTLVSFVVLFICLWKLHYCDPGNYFFVCSTCSLLLLISFSFFFFMSAPLILVCLFSDGLCLDQLAQSYFSVLVKLKGPLLGEI